jgi:hypothetical protein
MAVVVGSCCFSVLNSTVKFRGSPTSQRRFATPQRSIGSITPKAINHRRRALSPKRGSSSSSSSSNSKSNGEVNPLSHSLSSYSCLCIHETIRSKFSENTNFIFEAIIVTFEHIGVYGKCIALLLSYCIIGICEHIGGLMGAHVGFV